MGTTHRNKSNVRRKMKIFDMIAHEGYQYELCKLQCDFTIAVDKDHQWDETLRPIPNNVQFVDVVNLDIQQVEKYDVAIVHNYRQLQLLRHCRIPKILVMHCSKRGQGDAELLREDLSEYAVVFNSYKDKNRWNFECPNQRVIWHGFDPDEWPTSDKSINRLFTVGRRISERPKICGYNIIKEFEDAGLPVKIVGENPDIGIVGPDDFSSFRAFHKKYSVYLNPTIRSPMPRGRGEAMMSGIPVVTTGFYDEELFIKNGENGFSSNNVAQLKEYAALLLADEELRQEMGAAARETAIEHFHVQRFLTEWKQLLGEVTNEDTSKIAFTKPYSPKIYVTRKDSSAGGGTVSTNNATEGLRKEGYDVSCIDINSKGWVSHVDGQKLPTDSSRMWENFIKDNPCSVIVFDDIDRYIKCKHCLDPRCRVIICILGNPQVHDSSWYEDGILNVDQNPHISKILCRPTYAKYLQALFGEERILSWYGGCDGIVLREKYGTAMYKHPSEGALVISAHRGTDWWKNPNTALLAAFGIYRKHPEIIYFKPSGNENEEQLLENVQFDIQYGGTPKEGMNREDLLATMACAQLALEPAYSEGFSRSCNEMMNMGVPVIQGPNAKHLQASDLLATHLMLTDPSDAYELLEKSLALLENPKLWKEVSEECIRFSAQFNTEQELEILHQVIEQEARDATRLV